MPQFGISRPPNNGSTPNLHSPRQLPPLQVAEQQTSVRLQIFRCQLSRLFKIGCGPRKIPRRNCRLAIANQSLYAWARLRSQFCSAQSKQQQCWIAIIQSEDCGYW